MTDENGKTPAPPPADVGEVEKTPATDVVMGIIGLAVALLLAGIALDLITGGAVSRLLPVKDSSDDG